MRVDAARGACSRSRFRPCDCHTTVAYAGHPKERSIGRCALTLAHSSMREASDAAGVTHPALYRHFTDKRALLVRIERRGGAGDHDPACEVAVARLEPDDLHFQGRYPISTR